MKELSRTVSSALREWKSERRRKVLLIRGARQVGKTHSVRRLGTEFEHFLEVNFEESKEIHSLFHQDINVRRIIQTLAVRSGVPVIPGKTLVFFDEIQSCIDAIRSLRFFYEKMPDLHVVAAGSLLEFAIREVPSYGVGRIQTLFMYPLTFHEFLTAIHPTLVPVVEGGSVENPMEVPLHRLASDYYKTYQIVGGMPEVVSEYIETGDLLKCTGLLDNLIQSFQTDFAKYKNRAPVQTLRNVFYSIALQAGNKFVYKHAAPELDSKTTRAALELIIQAGLAYKIPHTSASGLPLGGQINPRKFKILPLDSGIYQRLLGMNLQDYFFTDDAQLINRGSLAEVTAGIQLMHHQSPGSEPQLYYWHREAKSSNAEIDYLIQQETTIIPIEVKAGTKGQMQSMHLFLKEKRLERGIRLSLENFDRVDSIEIVPLYAAGRLVIS